MLVKNIFGQAAGRAFGFGRFSLTKELLRCGRNGSLRGIAPINRGARPQPMSGARSSLQLEQHDAVARNLC